MLQGEIICPPFCECSFGYSFWAMAPSSLFDFLKHYHLISACQKFVEVCHLLITSLHNLFIGWDLLFFLNFPLLLY